MIVFVLQDPKTAQEAYQALLGMLDADDHRVLPAVHFERVLYCDKLGQVGRLSFVGLWLLLSAVLKM